MTTCSIDRTFSTGLLYALKNLERPNISLKNEQIVSVEAMTEKMSMCGYQLVLERVLCFQVLPFMMDQNEPAV